MPQHRFCDGYHLKSLSEVHFYVFAFHEFSVASELIDENGSKYRVDDKDAWFKYGIGANFNINNVTYVWCRNVQVVRIYLLGA